MFQVFKKYHFWILCALILLAYLGTWYMATSAMTKETAARVSEINSAISTGQSIQSVLNHPNEASKEMMNDLIGQEADQVRKAWAHRFREQEDVLVWPEELKPDFIAAVEKLIPIELTVAFPTPPEQELKLDFRNRYRDYIREEMPKLAEIIGAKWKAPTATGTGMGGYGGGYDGGYDGGDMGMGMGMGMGGGYEGEDEYGGGYGGEDEYGGEGMGYPGMRGMPGVPLEDPTIVQWSTANQAQLQGKSFNWVRPNTLQMLYAQEDLWILRSLMRMIKSTNGDADAQYNAAVKEIMTIDLGPAARGITSAGKVKKGQAVATGGYGEGMDDMYGEDYGDDYEGGEMEMGDMYGEGETEYGPPSAREAADPADNRYVDQNMEPLTGERLRSGMNSAQAADAFLVVAKRMPVRIRVKMNIMKLPLFLCEFANADLPIEVRQVRINPSGSSAGGSYGGGYDGGYDGGSSMMGMGGPYGGGGEDADEYSSGMPGMGQISAADRAALAPYDGTVEIYGLIYLYNPVDPEKLRLGEEELEEMAANGGLVEPDTATTGAPAPGDGSGAVPSPPGSADNAPTVPAGKSGTPPATAPPGGGAPGASPAGTPAAGSTLPAAAAAPAGATP